MTDKTNPPNNLNDIEIGNSGTIVHGGPNDMPELEPFMEQQHLEWFYMLDIIIGKIVKNLYFQTRRRYKTNKCKKTTK